MTRHPVLAAIVATYFTGLVIYGFVTRAELTIPYGVIVAAGAVFVARMEPPEGFSPVVLAGLALWGFGHLAGGLVDIGDDRTVYNAVLLDRVHVDNIVHFIGFGSAGLAWWEATRRWLPALEGHRVGIWAATWLAGMGAGAFNEVVEFIITLLVAETNIGGYQNTGRDLIANMLGAASAGLVAARPSARSR